MKIDLYDLLITVSVAAVLFGHITVSEEVKCVAIVFVLKVLAGVASWFVAAFNKGRQEYDARNR